MVKPVTSGGKTQLRSACQLQMVVLPKGCHGNPLRILEPNRKRLTSLKAERVFLVSEETIKNIQIVMILPDVIASLDRFAISFGQDLCLLMKEHDELRQKYEYGIELLEEGKRLEKEHNEWLEMKEKQESLFSESSSDSKSEKSESDEEYVIRVKGQSMTTLRNNLVLVKQELAYSIKNILRKFKSDPTAMKTILEQAGRLVGAKGNLVKGLEHLQSIVRAKLLTTPAELEERKYYIGKVVQRENKILKIKEKLQVEYALQMKIKKDEEKKQNAVIDNLKEALRRLNETSSKDCYRSLAEANKKITGDMKLSEGKQRTVVQDCIDLKKAVGERLKTHFEDEREKRKRKFKLSTEVYNWIQKYDADMGLRQNEYDEILVDRDNLRQDLDDLGRHFLALEKEYWGIIERRKLTEEAEEKRKHELKTKTAAVIRLQACWRGYRVRKQLKKKDKKEKKGKKE